VGLFGESRCVAALLHAMLQCGIHCSIARVFGLSRRRTKLPLGRDAGGDYMWYPPLMFNSWPVM
jgi:hypothetical protein